MSLKSKSITYWITTALIAFFIEQCRRNLHMVICMSPVGDAFRTRLRMFPSLVNCCTIDWYSSWPADALQSVATQFLKEVSMDSEETRAAVIQMCMVFHTTIRDETAEAFVRELQRRTYVTPTSYLELITTYKSLLDVKRSEVKTIKTRYEVGLQKLLGAEESVGQMKVELQNLQPVLIKTAAETEEMLKVIEVQSREAGQKKAVVQAEEAEASEKAASAKARLSDSPLRCSGTMTCPWLRYLTLVLLWRFRFCRPSRTSARTSCRWRCPCWRRPWPRSTHSPRATSQRPARPSCLPRTREWPV